MKLLVKLGLFLIIGGIAMSFNTENNAMKENDPQSILAHFPEAGEGMVRHVIFVKEKSDEYAYQVEIMPGQVISVDCNNYILMGATEKKDLEGWGYNYYEFTSTGAVASTRKFCVDDTRTDKYITASSTMVRYNSKVPIVIYAPKGFDVKYRIWKAGKEQKSLIK